MQRASRAPLRSFSYRYECSCLITAIKYVLEIMSVVAHPTTTTSSPALVSRSLTYDSHTLEVRHGARTTTPRRILDVSQMPKSVGLQECTVCFVSHTIGNPTL